MKVALLTNMNNNYFVLLRFLRDSGIDAHLFMAEDEHSHFLPENDTWNIEKWSPFIHIMPVKYYDVSYLQVFNKEKLKCQLLDFDILMGSGPMPAYLEMCGLKLDIFLPYKTGIEYFDTPKAKINLKLRKDTFFIEKLQKVGLSKTKECVNWDLREITLGRLRQLNLHLNFTSVPMVYPEDKPFENEISPGVTDIISRIKKFDFVVCSASRHLWKKSWVDKIKHFGYDFINNNANQHMIYALDNLVKYHGAKDACLLFYEYGPHVKDSKELITKLGLDEYVFWMPLSPRKVILYMHNFIHLGIGDIAVGAWGGKSIEYLSKGVPCINSISDEVEHFEKYTSIPLPPFIKIKKPEELKSIFEKYYQNRDSLKSLALQSKDWFDKYEGNNLASKIVKLMKEIVDEKASLV